MLIQFHSHFPSFKLFTEIHTDIHTHTTVRNIRSRTLVSHPDPVSIIASRPPQNTTQLCHPKVDRFQTTLLKDCFQASFGRPLCAPRLSGPHRNRTVSHSGKRDVSARGGVAHTSLQHITLPGMPVQDCSVPFSLGTNVNSNRAGLQAFGVDEVFRLSTGPDTKLPVCVCLVEALNLLSKKLYQEPLMALFSPSSPPKGSKNDDGGNSVPVRKKRPRRSPSLRRASLLHKASVCARPPRWIRQHFGMR